MNERTFALALVAGVGLLAAPPASAQSDAVLARVGEEVVTLADVQAEVRRFAEPDRETTPWYQRRSFYEPFEAPAPVTAADRHAALDRLVRMALFAQGALSAEDGTDVQARTEHYERLFCTWRTAQEAFFPPADLLTSAAIAEFREQRTTVWFGRQIVSETEENANVVLGRLMTGADFPSLAKELSIDIGSRAAGGQMWPLRFGDWYPDILTVLLDQKPGDIGGPALTHFGYHVFHCDSILYEFETEEMIPSMRLKHLRKRSGVLAQMPAWVAEKVEEHGVRLIDEGVAEALTWMRPVGSTYLPPAPAHDYTPTSHPVATTAAGDTISVADMFEYVGALSIDDWPRPENVVSVRNAATRLALATALARLNRQGEYPVSADKESRIRVATLYALSEAYFEREVAVAEVDSAMAERIMVERPEYFMVPETISISAIGLETKKQADEVWSWIDGGMSFEEAAVQAKQLDAHAVYAPHTPFFPKGAFPEWDELLFSMNIGDVSEPVMAGGGWQIYRVNQTRDPRPMRRIELSDEELHERAVGILTHEAKEAHATRLRERFPVRIDEAEVERYLGSV